MTTTRDNLKQNNHTFKRNRTSGTRETTLFVRTHRQSVMTFKFANFRLRSKFNVRFAIQIARIQKYRIVRSIPSDILTILTTGISYGNDYWLSKFLKNYDRKITKKKSRKSRNACIIFTGSYLNLKTICKKTKIIRF